MVKFLRSHPSLVTVNSYPFKEVLLEARILGSTTLNTVTAFGEFYRKSKQDKFVSGAIHH